MEANWPLRAFRTWSAINGRVLTTSDAHQNVSALAWCPDGNKLISAQGNEQYSIRIWNAVTGEISQEHPEGVVLHLFWQPDNSKLSIHYPVGLAFYAAKTLEPIVGDGSNLGLLDCLENRATGNYILTAVWRPDSKRVVLADRNGKVQVWDASPATCLSLIR
jgi:WD40 repeat protein